MIRIEEACLKLMKELKDCEDVDEKLKEFKEFVFKRVLETMYGPKVWDKIEKFRKTLDKH